MKNLPAGRKSRPNPARLRLWQAGMLHPTLFNRQIKHSRQRFPAVWPGQHTLKRILKVRSITKLSESQYWPVRIFVTKQVIPICNQKDNIVFDCLDW
jgi:hypothetical protein